MEVPTCLAYEETQDKEQPAGLVAPISYGVYHHDKTPSCYYVSRAICLQAMMKVGASKLYCNVGKGWVQEQLMCYEQEALRKSRMLRWKK